MTKYTDSDHQANWEFKIVRSNLAGFRTRKSCNRSVPGKRGQAGPLWRSSIINVCDSSVRSVRGQEMRGWRLILTALNTELLQE